MDYTSALNWLINLEQGLYDAATLSYAFPSRVEGRVCEAQHKGSKVAVKAGKAQRVMYYKDGKRVAFNTLLAWMES